MARHEVVIHENTGATKTVAPYLGSYISKETLTLEKFAKAVGEKCGLPAIQVIAILGGAFEAIEALEGEALVRVHTDLGVVCGVITGSFPTADAAFDPARNALELALRLDDSLRLDLADTVPVIITDADITKLRVDNAMDLEVESPMNLIHGQHPFRVAGLNMELGDQGAAAFLENALGTTFPLVIDEVVSKQLFIAHTAELLPAGDYKLTVKSRAGDAAGPLQTSSRKVKYLRVVDPVPPPMPIAESEDGLVKVMSLTDDGQSETFTTTDAWTMTGEGLFTETAEGRKWHIDTVEVRGNGVAQTMTVTDVSEDGRTATIECLAVDINAGTYTDMTLEVNIRTDGESDEYETLVIPIPTFIAVE